MSYTVLQAITDAMLDLAVISPNSTISGDDATNGLFKLNVMIDDWNSSRVNLWTIGRYSQVLTPGKGQYQVGPGGADFPAIPRPIGVNSAGIVLAGTSYRVDLKIITQEAAWEQIAQKTSSAEAPDYLYYDNAMISDGGAPPKFYGNLYLAGVPSKPCTLNLNIWQQLQNYTAVTDTIYLPPMYSQALIKQLALRLASSFGAIPSDQLKQDAAESFASLKTYNAEFLRGIGGQGPLEVQAAVQAAQQQAPPAQQ